MQSGPSEADGCGVGDAASLVAASPGRRPPQPGSSPRPPKDPATLTSIDAPIPAALVASETTLATSAGSMASEVAGQGVSAAPQPPDADGPAAVKGAVPRTSRSATETMPTFDADTSEGESSDDSNDLTEDDDLAGQGAEVTPLLSQGSIAGAGQLPPASGEAGGAAPPGGEPRAGATGGAPPSTAPANLRTSSGYPSNNLPPKTGISVPMLYPSHEFIRNVPKDPELLYIAPEALFDEVVRLEADRLSKPESVKNLLVYDSLEPPPMPQGQGEGGPMLGSPSAAVSVGPPPLPGPVEDLPPYYSPSGASDLTLVFESRFECGNLRRAIQIYDFEYDLVLNPDYNTKSHTQWYFFRVSNTRKGPEYRFNIINMVKPTSVYNEGMRPLMYSTVEANANNVGWVRGGDNIIYYQNGVRRKDKGGTNYYTLTFSVKFEHDCDMVYFAHCYPYSYSDLQKDLQKLEADPMMSRRLRRRKLCETLAGNACDLITITSFCSDPAAIRSRRAVVITARVHPGESNSSWVMKGMLDYLTGSSLDARILRDNFVFKIIPMLNPDGVIVGNYRCSLVGHDLNRQWGEPSRKLHPTIYFTKNMFRHLLDDRDVILYVDIHGHSRKKNVFMYGNSDPSCLGLREKIFPRLLCRSSDCFSFDDCCFKTQKNKESSARVVVYKELSVTNSFTLEASFCGADFGPLGDQHFTTRHLEEMGYMVCDAILDFCDPDQTKVIMVCKELQALFPDDGNSDDVSDSDVDEAALQRARKRAAKLKNKKSKDKDSKKGEKSGGGKKASKKSADKADKGDKSEKTEKSARKPSPEVDARAPPGSGNPTSGAVGAASRGDANTAAGATGTGVVAASGGGDSESRRAGEKSAEGPNGSTAPPSWTRRPPTALNAPAASDEVESDLDREEDGEREYATVTGSSAPPREASRPRKGTASKTKTKKKSDKSDKK
eukprot:TRINITY_DN24257_c0_g1_i4.p1 TRINITY_DN24257_c0_g1~~TRINITY_DN24257_c0_g1_i4.p1  ORF type:complete len:946 (-),score=227.62 TRINITY_DN24257_c0_g1_i4:494-3331(-)